MLSPTNRQLQVTPRARSCSLIFFFSSRRRHTRLQGDWSSDVCSSDLYMLTADNGAMWELKGDTVNLSDHVGHTVTVTGTVDHSKMHSAKEKAKEKTQDNPKEQGHLTVTNIKHVKESCSR